MKKLLLLCTMLATVTTLLSGCTPKEQNVEGNKTADTPYQPNTAVIALSSDIATLDPSIGYEVFGNFYFYATYDNLLKLEGSDISEPKPCLAKECIVDETGKVYTFKLRDDIKFSSGNKFTSKDVAFSINRAKNIKGNATHHVENIEKVETPDEYTAVITLKEKDASFKAKLAQNSLAVIDSTVVKSKGGTDAQDASTTDKAKEFLDTASAGSGPYVLKSWTPKIEMVLEKNPNYWGTAPAYDRIIVKEVKDPNAEIQMLEKGEIDIAFSIGPDQLSAMKDNTNVQIISSPTATISFLLMNQDESIGGPVSNPKVQQAIKYAIDYDGFKTIAGDGTQEPFSFVPIGFTGAKSRPADHKNIEKAKALMSEAGFESGFSITLTAANFASNGLQWTTMAQKIKEDLKPIGIDVKIETGEIGVVIDSYRQGKVPFLIMHWSPDYYDINNHLAFAPGEIVGLRANWKGEADPEITEISKKIFEELDNVKRSEYSAQMQDMMWERSPYAFIIQHPISFAASNKIQGVVYNDLCKIQLSELKPAQE